MKLFFSFKGKPGRPVGPIQFSDISINIVPLSWHPPTKDGGKPVTNYIVEVKKSKCSTWSKCGDVSAVKTIFIAEKLLEGQNYFFRVSAVNEKGPGAPLESLTSVRLEKPIGKF